MRRSVTHLAFFVRAFLRSFLLPRRGDMARCGHVEEVVRLPVSVSSVDVCYDLRFTCVACVFWTAEVLFLSSLQARDDCTRDHQQRVGRVHRRRLRRARVFVVGQRNCMRIDSCNIGSNGFFIIQTAPLVRATFAPLTVSVDVVFGKTTHSVQNVFPASHMPQRGRLSQCISRPHPNLLSTVTTACTNESQRRRQRFINTPWPLNVA
ncbi:hypothetical protein BDW22DRAFT_141369 [Trametopsis cervina]|nr:hypothetical protein BDW22DRAFT_141369 [Trametopsis cervina]